MWNTIHLAQIRAQAGLPALEATLADLVAAVAGELSAGTAALPEMGGCEPALSFRTAGFEDEFREQRQ